MVGVVVEMIGKRSSRLGIHESCDAEMSPWLQAVLSGFR